MHFQLSRLIIKFLRQDFVKLIKLVLCRTVGVSLGRTKISFIFTLSIHTICHLSFSIKFHHLFYFVKRNLLLD